MSRFAIECGDMVCVIDPEAGGSIAALRHGDLDLLRPAPPRDGSAFSALEYAAFAMVPFVGRIHHGQFEFQGARIKLPANMPPEPHAIHGYGWQESWTVSEQTAQSATLTFRRASDRWPWSYEAQQVILVTKDALSVMLTLTNLSDQPMPSGFGWHPYFPRPDARLALNTVAVWSMDPESGQNHQTKVKSNQDLSPGHLVDDLSLDTTFSVGSTEVDMTWPTHTLTMRSDPVFMAATVFVPRGQDFFCVEPVSHVPNAVRGGYPSENTGLKVLEPGEALSGSIVLSVKR